MRWPGWLQDLLDQARWRRDQLRPRVTRLEYRRPDGTTGTATIERTAGLGLICRDGNATFYLGVAAATDQGQFRRALRQRMHGPLRLRTEDGTVLRERDVFA